VAKNTSRPANVEIVRSWRTIYALQQAAILLSKKAWPFLTVSKKCFRFPEALLLIKYAAHFL